MNYKKKILYLLVFCSFFSCQKKIKNNYSEITDAILNQYPMFVKVSPNGKKILLKNREAKTFEILTTESPLSNFNIIDKSNFTQLSLTWHPNSKDIIFQEFNPDSGMFDLYMVNLDSKKRKLIDLPSSSNAIPPLKWDKNGRRLAYLATNRQAKLYIYDYLENQIIRTYSNLDPYSAFEWASDSTIIFIKNPSKGILSKSNIYENKISQMEIMENAEIEDLSIIGDNLLFTAKKSNDSYFQCYEINLMDSNLKKRTHGNFNVSNCRYSAKGNKIYYNRNENGANKLYSSDSTINRFFVHMTKEAGSFRIGLDLMDTLYVTNSDYSSPPSLIRFDLKNLNQTIAYKPPNAGNLRLEKPEFVSIKGKSEFDIPGFFWKADSTYIGKKTIIYIHGGPYLQSTPLWNIRSKVFTENGFNELVINYQGSSGYSNKFAKSNKESDQIKDILSSVAWLERKYNINQSDIILIGSSYGGKLVLKAFDYLENIGGIVLISGVVNENVKNIKNIKKTKLLGFYGEYDPRSRKAYDYFTKYGLFNEEMNNFILFENEGHFFHRTISWSNIYGRIIESYSDTPIK